MAKRYLRKRHLRVRYADVHDRTIERMVKDGRLPLPEFPFGNRIPAWDEEKLSEHERKLAGLIKQPKSKTTAADSKVTAA
jgi:hypothetical protein